MEFRRKPLRSILGLAVCGWMGVAFSPAVAQPPAPAAVKLTVHPITEGRLYWVEGGGGNSGIIVGDNGVVVIDAKTTPDAGRALVAEVAKITTKPITHVIITHSDGDHVNGLAGFPDGLKIVAHANNRVEQQAVYLYAAVEVDGGRCLPPRNRLPNQIIFKERVRTTIDGVRFDFRYFGPAHTGGDLVIYLPDDKLAFTGDLITSSVLTHPEKNGSFDGWFRAAQGLLGLPADRYLGGHAASLDTKDSLKKRIAGYQAVREKVDALVEAGKSLQDVKVAMGDPAKDSSGCRGIPYPSLSEVEYNERIAKDGELK